MVGKKYDVEMLYDWLKLSEWKWKHQNVCQCVTDFFFINVAYQSLSNQQNQLYTHSTKKVKRNSCRTNTIMCVAYIIIHTFTLWQYRLLSCFAFLDCVCVRLWLCSVLCIYDLLEVVYLEVMCQIFQYMLLFRTNGLLLYKKSWFEQKIIKWDFHWVVSPSMADIHNCKWSIRIYLQMSLSNVYCIFTRRKLLCMNFTEQ